MEYTTSDKGAIGEAAFLLWASKKMYYAAKAPEKAPYDFFLDRHDGKILRVQVKYRTPTQDSRIDINLRPFINNKNNHADYTNGCIDTFVIYNSVTEEIAMIHLSDIPTNQNVITFLCRESINPKSNNRFFSTYVV